MPQTLSCILQQEKQTTSSWWYTWESDGPIFLVEPCNKCCSNILWINSSTQFCNKSLCLDLASILESNYLIALPYFTLKERLCCREKQKCIQMDIYEIRVFIFLYIIRASFKKYIVWDDLTNHSYKSISKTNIEKLWNVLCLFKNLTISIAFCYWLSWEHRKYTSLS